MSTKTKFDIIFNMKTFAETYKEEAYRHAKEKAIVLNLSSNQQKELIENIDEFLKIYF